MTSYVGTTVPEGCTPPSSGRKSFLLCRWKQYIPPKWTFWNNLNVKVFKHWPGWKLEAIIFKIKSITYLTYLLSFYKTATSSHVKPVRHSNLQPSWSCSQLAWRRTSLSQWQAVLVGYPFLRLCNNPAEEIKKMI
jgi:hypothetical protein